MNIYLASSYIKAFKKITKNNPRRKQKIKERLELFVKEPDHPSLKLHKLTGGHHNNWSFAVEEDLRVLFTYAEDGVILVDIGKHEDVY